MQFMPTLNLWDQTIQDRIRSGDLKLQRGQWCICGIDNDKRCRYVSHTADSINVVHWQGTSKDTRDLFQRRIKQLKSMKKLTEK